MLDLSHLPKTEKLDDGRELTIRLPQPTDEIPLLNFYRDLPAEELLRFREDVTDAAFIHERTHHMDFGRLIPLLGLIDGEIVTSWSLHHREQVWTNHHANLRGIVKPGARGHGIAAKMVYGLLAIAHQLELERVVIELTEEQKRVLEHYKKIGFKIEATLKDWIKDLRGRHHDLLILSMSLEPAWKKIEETILDYESREG